MGSRARAEHDFECEPVSLQQAAGGGNHEYASQLRHRLVAVECALRHVRGATIEVRQDRTVTTALEAKPQETALADGTALHLQRLVLKRSYLRSRSAE